MSPAMNGPLPLDAGLFSNAAKTAASSWLNEAWSRRVCADAPRLQSANVAAMS